MQEVLVVWVIEPAVLLRRHVVVHYQVDLGDVNASRQHVRRDKRREIALPKTIDDRVTIADFETANDNFGLDIAGL